MNAVGAGSGDTHSTTAPEPAPAHPAAKSACAGRSGAARTSGTAHAPVHAQDIPQDFALLVVAARALAGGTLDEDDFIQGGVLRFGWASLIGKQRNLLEGILVRGAFSCGPAGARLPEGLIASGLAEELFVEIEAELVVRVVAANLDRHFAPGGTSSGLHEASGAAAAWPRHRRFDVNQHPGGQYGAPVRLSLEVDLQLGVP